MSTDADSEMRRFHGLQAFLMSLTGVEAFTNVFFLLHGRQNSHVRVLEINAERYGSLVSRLERLVDSAFLRLCLIRTKFSVVFVISTGFEMRSFTHGGNPTSMTLGGAIPIHIDGLSHNFQATFEDPEFCREAYLWCLLLVSVSAKLRVTSTQARFAFSGRVCMTFKSSG